MIEKTGFKIVKTKVDSEIKKKYYYGLNVESLTYIAEKV